MRQMASNALHSNSEQYGWKRFLAIDPLWFDDDGVIHVETTRGTDEPAPGSRGSVEHGRK